MANLARESLDLRDQFMKLRALAFRIRAGVGLEPCGHVLPALSEKRVAHTPPPGNLREKPWASGRGGIAGAARRFLFAFTTNTPTVRA